MAEIVPKGPSFPICKSPYCLGNLTVLELNSASSVGPLNSVVTSLGKFLKEESNTSNPVSLIFGFVSFTSPFFSGAGGD
mgnify:CR=1 FL=1